MKIFFALLFLTVNNFVFAQTQAEMYQAAYAKYVKVDQELNAVYQIILAEYKKDTLFTSNLRKSQRLWLKSRDADLAMKYPEYAPNIYGSIQPTCYAYYQKELTENRLKFLREWVRGTEQGDACSGSVKITEDIQPANRQKAFIQKDGTISLIGNIKKDYRIFGYQKKNTSARKLILFSVFTNEVKYNAYNCPYGAYYNMNDLKGLRLKYLDTEGYFIKVAILEDGKKVAEVFMEKDWFEFK